MSPVQSRHEFDTGVIEIRLRELAQLFNSLDPSPFHERDIDHDAEQHILSWAREFPSSSPIAIVIHLPAGEARAACERDLGTAISSYFSERALAAQRDLRELFRMGWRYLSIGVPVLVACLTASQLARSSFGDGPLLRALEESLIILGWVANWKPLETFLYDWWPVKRQRDMYLRLAKAQIRIKPH